MCWGQARHNPRNLINWLCHKLVSLVFNNYDRNYNSVWLKKCCEVVKGVLVSVSVGDNIYKKDCHNPWTTVSVFWMILKHLKHPPDDSEACSVFTSDSRRMASDTTVTKIVITDPQM